MASQKLFILLYQFFFQNSPAVKLYRFLSKFLIQLIYHYHLNLLLFILISCINSLSLFHKFFCPFGIFLINISFTTLGSLKTSHHPVIASTDEDRKDDSNWSSTYWMVFIVYPFFCLVYLKHIKMGKVRFFFAKAFSEYTFFIMVL